MGDIALRVRGLSKQYRIGVARKRADTLRDAVVGAARGLLNLFSANGADQADSTIWALKDVSFEVKRGEVLGVIGRNGAGKSTLLKILSRITEPTAGEIDIFGRVGSLLEVGTGFHPELSGRENIYLNGAILGMQRREIQHKFDEIVDFAGVEQFIDTPVKHYSSGMYMRLAFAVAANMETEILLVDEVLAVGDAEFQKKCLGKMGEVAHAGRTVVFVSHNIAAVRVLCGEGILLSAGKLALAGPVDLVANAYEAAGKFKTAGQVWPVEEAPGSESVRLLSIMALRKTTPASESRFTRSDEITIQMRFVVRSGRLRLNPHIHVFTQAGQLLFISTNLHDRLYGEFVFEPGEYTAICQIPPKLLNQGTFDISAYIIRDLNHAEVALENAMSIEILDDGSDRRDYIGGWHGLIRPTLLWRIRTT